MQDSLANAIKQNRISHAWLFTGERQATEAEALSFAQALLCSRPVAGQACGQCASCRKVLAGNHVDLQILAPAKNKTVVTIEQTRTMQQLASLRSYEGGRQVVILQQADMLQKAAANSLLKILEEPPAELIFILTAENGERLLPTILSRCAIVKLAGGMRAKDGALEEKAAAFLQELPDCSPARLLLFAEEIREDRLWLVDFLAQLQLLCRDAAVVYWGGGSSRLLSRVQPSRFPFAGETILTAAKLIADAQAQLSQNINTKLLVDVLLLNLGDLAGNGL